MIYSQKKLSPALTVHCVQTDKFKSEKLSFFLVQPIDRDSYTASPLVMSVLTRGTEKYPTRGDINKRLDMLYGTTISATQKCIGSKSFLGYSFWMLGDKYTDGSINIFEGAVDLMDQILFHPLWDENGDFNAHYVKSEVTKQCDAIESIINNPRAYASKRCNEIMFEGDPFALTFLGRTEDVRALENDDLKRTYETLVYHSPIEIFYVGAKPLDEVEAILRRQILPHLTGEDLPQFAPLAAWTREGDVKEVTEPMSFGQSSLVLGFRTGVVFGDEDYYPMLLCNEIYGMSPISKLFMNVRERLSLCYQCSSSYGAGRGTIFVTSGIDADKRPTAMDEILRQLSLMQSGEITAAELEAGKRSIQNWFRAIGDSPSSIESFYMNNAHYGYERTTEACIEAIEGVTLESVVAAARKITLDTVYFLEGVGDGGEEADYEDD